MLIRQSVHAQADPAGVPVAMMRPIYPTDLTDEQWSILQPLIPRV